MASNYFPTGRNVGLLVLFFLVLFFGGTWMLVRADGYIVLWHPFRLVKTGVIRLRIEPNSALAVTLNGSPTSTGQRDFPDLVPGRYTIVVARTSFTQWEETVDLAAGQATAFDHITLFYTDPVRQVVPDADRHSFEQVLANTEPLKTDLQIIDGEIWNGNQLVARYSTPVSDVMWGPGRTHLFALLGSTIHVMEPDGGHDQIIVTAPTGAAPIRFVPISGGTELVVEADNDLAVYHITESESILEPALQRLRSQVQ